MTKLGKNLYITEKPSVAASFASVLGIDISKSDRGRGYAEDGKSVVTWCIGHLVTMAYPDAYDPKYKEWKTEHLPIIPDEYKYIVIEDRGISKQFDVIKRLITREDIECVYACTDSGREGEYIFRLVYSQSGSSKPAKRVWISSQTEEAIKRGIDEAKDIREFDPLAKAAYSRAKEDWLFGMNFSRMFTCKYGRSLSQKLNESKSTVIPIGRVMTCVLGLIVDRENEIRNFVPKKHYGVVGKFKSQEMEINYTGKWQPAREQILKQQNVNQQKLAGQIEKEKKVDEKASKTIPVEEEEEKYISEEEALKLIEKLQGKEAKVKKVEIKVKNELPPLLFNLAELQSEANKKFKLPVVKTLEIAQSLYEKKLISYPRTDSRVMSTDVLPEIPKILNGLYKNQAFTEHISKIKENGGLKIDKKSKRFVDDSKVTDHYAIIPTYVTSELSKLDQDTRNIYELIVKRFLAIFYPAAQFNTVRVETEVSGELFVSNAKTMLSPGWKQVYEVSSKKEEDEITDSPIHNLKKGEEVDVVNLEMEEKETKPPSRYTDGSLIITMEKAGKFIENEELRAQIKTSGIGTSATRAGIIKKLKDIEHISIHNKTQIVTPTPKGEAIVELVRKTAKELLNPTLTASWEKGLAMIENGETTEEVFREKLHSYIHKSIAKVRSR